MTLKMRGTAMTKAIRYTIIAGVICGVIAALVYYWVIPPAPRREAAKTEQIVESIEEANAQFGKDVTEHKTTTETKVMVIRERVENEVAALDPDGLANAMVYEIMLWRGASADMPETRSSGVRR
jgi:hypothetical protein